MNNLFTVQDGKLYTGIAVTPQEKKRLPSLCLGLLGQEKTRWVSLLIQNPPPVVDGTHIFEAEFKFGKSDVPGEKSREYPIITRKNPAAKAIFVRVNTQGPAGPCGRFHESSMSKGRLRVEYPCRLTRDHYWVDEVIEMREPGNQLKIRFSGSGTWYHLTRVEDSLLFGLWEDRPGKQERKSAPPSQKRRRTQQIVHPAATYEVDGNGKLHGKAGIPTDLIKNLGIAISKAQRKKNYTRLRVLNGRGHTQGKLDMKMAFVAVLTANVASVAPGNGDPTIVGKHTMCEMWVLNVGASITVRGTLGDNYNIVFTGDSVKGEKI